MQKTARSLPTLPGKAAARREVAPVAETFESRLLFHFAVHDPIPDVSVLVNAPPGTIALGPRIYDETKGTTVRLNYGTMGTIDLQMLDYEAPLSVANFLNYVNNNTFDNTVIHRSEPGRPPNPVPFVIQGGGFRPSGQDISPDGTPTVPNEFSPRRSNLRGTVAYAKLGSDPNSATTEWFINLGNNSGNLDNQNGGFTVFARVIGAGMTVADNIVALPRVNASNINSAWNHFPVTRTTNPDLPTLDPSTETGTATSPAVDQMVILQDSTVLANAPAVTFTATSSNPSLVNPVVSGSSLTLNYGANQVGTATVTVVGTEAGNPATVTETFTVTVAANQVPMGRGANAQQVVFTDADGTTATFRIKRGWANIVIAGSNVRSTVDRTTATVTGTNLAIAAVELFGDEPAVSVTTTTAGDGRVVINSVRSDGPVRHFIGRGVNLLGTSTFVGGVGRFEVTKAENAIINFDLDPSDTGRPRPVSVRAGTFENSTLDSELPLKELRVDGDLSGTVTAPTINTLTANSMTNADVDVFQAFAQNLVALNKLNVRGAMVGSNVRSNNDIGAVSATSVAGSTIFAGVNTPNIPDGGPLPSDAGAFVNPVTIRNLTFKNTTGPAFRDSRVSASSIGRAVLGAVESANNGNAFGLAAQFVSSLSASDGETPVVGNNLDAPGQSIDRTDFEVRLF